MAILEVKDLQKSFSASSRVLRSINFRVEEGEFLVIMGLADEPVSNLDPKMSRVVLDIRKQICLEDRITVLVSLHTMELARAYASS